MSKSYERIQEVYQQAQAGDILVDRAGNKWLKPEQSIPHHLEDCLICIGCGTISHYSRVEMKEINNDT
jgi:hypothetical protein